MPPADTSASLTAGAACLDCIPKGMQMPVLISIFAQIAGMSADAATLVSDARCLQCIPHGMQMPVLIYLAQQIIAGGGGGGMGVGLLQVGVNGWAGPPALPPDPTRPWLSYPSGGGGISEWDVPSQTWI